MRTALKARSASIRRRVRKAKPRARLSLEISPSRPGNGDLCACSDARNSAGCRTAIGHRSSFVTWKAAPAITWLPTWASRGRRWVPVGRGRSFLAERLTRRAGGAALTEPCSRPALPARLRLGFDMAHRRHGQGGRACGRRAGHGRHRPAVLALAESVGGLSRGTVRGALAVLVLALVGLGVSLTIMTPQRGPPGGRRTGGRGKTKADPPADREGSRYPTTRWLAGSGPAAARQHRHLHRLCPDGPCLRQSGIHWDYPARTVPPQGVSHHRCENHHRSFGCLFRRRQAHRGSSKTNREPGTPQKKKKKRRGGGWSWPGAAGGSGPRRSATADVGLVGHDRRLGPGPPVRECSQSQPLDGRGRYLDRGRAGRSRRGRAEPLGPGVSAWTSDPGCLVHRLGHAGPRCRARTGGNGGGSDGAVAAGASVASAGRAAARERGRSASTIRASSLTAAERPIRISNPRQAPSSPR